MITVIGAGMGGLTLARVLHLNGIDVQVLERDASPTARHQGGMLDIHEESGQFALQSAGLLEEFRAITLEEGDAMRILDKAGNVLMSDAGNGKRPEVDRGTLRDLLLSSLPDGMVRWNTHVTNVLRVAGGYELSLWDGNSVTTELLVGADGAWSKVRALLSESKPVYSGISFVETHFFDADVRHPVPAATVGKGLMFALSDEKGFLAHRETNAELCVYVALKVPADWDNAEISRQSLLEHFADWDTNLQALIADSEGHLAPRPIYALPIGHRWDRVPGVTLVGDAAHLMSPFAGEGVNLAMLDGAELAMAILAHPSDIEAALAAYEAVMFSRSEIAAAESARNLDLCFQPNGAQELVDQMASYSAKEA